MVRTHAPQAVSKWTNETASMPEELKRDMLSLVKKKKR